MLIPKQVTVSSSFKAFGFREGLSTGSDISVTFDIPSGYSGSAVRAEIAKQKFALDSMVIAMEAAKGTIPKELQLDLVSRARAHTEAFVKGCEEKDGQ
jgi:hypothetical protein